MFFAKIINSSQIPKTSTSYLTFFWHME